MPKRVMRRAVISAAVLLLIGSGVAYADVINADGDRVLPSAQTMVNLGSVGAGATITYDVYFLLECRNTAHAAPGSSITLTPGSPSAPPGGSISGTPTTIGPVPATWPAAGQACVGDAVFQSTTPSVVTIVAPMVADTGYIYRLQYAKAPSTGLTGLSTMTFRLDVSTNNAPVVTAPADQTVEGDTLGGWLSTYSATATDVEDGPLAAPCVPAAGSVLPVGDTIVVCTATDAAGANSSDSFRVTVTDTTDPVLSGVPAGLASDTPVLSGATVGWPALTAVDLVDGTVAVTCSPASGSLFALGSTTVACSATDTHGNGATSSFAVDVTLVDTTPPVLGGVPADIAVITHDLDGAVVTWTAPSAVDNIDGPLSATCAPRSGSLFAVGPTTVRCSATDAHGNVGRASFTVQVTFIDATPPTLGGVPTAIWMDTPDPAGAIVGWPSPSANDEVDGAIPVTCSPASGSHFAVGATTVNCSATDAAGNDAQAAPFVVHLTLVDSTAPVISGVPADMDLNTTDPAGAVATWPAPSARDEIDGTVTVSCAPASGSQFRVGSTTVTCSAADAAGNDAARSFTVRVTLTVIARDTTAPTLVGMPGDIVVQSNPAARMAVTWPTPSAVDDVDGPVPVTCSPTSGWSFPDGATSVTCSASDSAGNLARGSFTVTVTPAVPVPDPGPVGGLEVTWGKPVRDTAMYKMKLGPKLELKASIAIDGVALRKKTGSPMLIIEKLTECGGTVVERRDGEALKGSGRDWKVELKTSKLGVGCWRLSVAVAGAEDGAFELMLVDKETRKSDRGSTRGGDETGEDGD